MRIKQRNTEGDGGPLCEQHTQHHHFDTVSFARCKYASSQTQYATNYSSFTFVFTFVLVVCLFFFMYSFAGRKNTPNDGGVLCVSTLLCCPYHREEFIHIERATSATTTTTLS